MASLLFVITRPLQSSDAQVGFSTQVISDLAFAGTRESFNLAKAQHVASEQQFRCELAGARTIKRSNMPRVHSRRASGQARHGRRFRFLSRGQTGPARFSHSFRDSKGWRLEKDFATPTSEAANVKSRGTCVITRRELAGHCAGHSSSM